MQAIDPPHSIVPKKTGPQAGFTLIELSVVLIIIGLIVGGVLVGRDLVKAADMRAQISQLSRLSTAIATFKVKYDDLPGDITPAKTVQFGFPTNNPYVNNGNGNYGDGNGLITGTDGLQPATSACCEPVSLFYQLDDLHLFSDGFKRTKNYWDLAFWPPLKVNPNAGLFVHSFNGNIWFFLGFTTESVGAWIGVMNGKPALTPAQSYALDAKLDDGIPSTGNVFAADFLTGGGGTQGLDTTASQCVTDISARIYNINSAQANIQWCRLYVRMQ